jgi:hypothetical protein
VLGLDLDAKAIAYRPVWHEQFVYILETNGLLRKIDTDELREVDRLDIGRKCRGLTLLRDGLAVTVADPDEVWFIRTEKKLAAFHQAPCPNVQRVLPTGISTVLFATTNKPDELLVLDLSKRKVVRRYDEAGLWKEWGGVVTIPKGADVKTAGLGHPVKCGSYLICFAHDRLHRYAVEGTNLVYKEISERVVSDCTPVFRPGSGTVYIPMAQIDGKGGRGIASFQAHQFRSPSWSPRATWHPCSESAGDRTRAVTETGQLVSVGFAQPDQVEAQLIRLPREGRVEPRFISQGRKGRCDLIVTDRHVLLFDRKR